MQTTSSFFELLEKGIKPNDFIERSRIDEIHSDVMEVMGRLPVFHSWIASLKLSDEMAMRDGADVPVYTTQYNISTAEAGAMRNNSKVGLRFFASMAQALVDRAIPCDEVFAIVTDCIHSLAYATGNRIENVH